MPKENEPQKLEVLPTQEKFFSTEKLRRSARAGTHLPDPTMAPYGYDPKQHYGHLFPKLELPALFPPASHHPDDHVSFGSPNLEPHRLYLGDNLYVLRQLPSELVDLIYIDPPFFSNRTYTQIWGDDNEIRSFTDIFQDGMFSYLAWLNARLWEMKRVLKSTGSIYVHCDWHASHYIKCELDRIFGYDNFRNEIVWRRATPTGGKVKSKMFPRDCDYIFLYIKDNNSEVPFNNIYTDYRQEYVEKFFYHSDSDGKRYALQTLGDYSKEKIEEFKKQGRIYQSKKGTVRLKQYLDESRGLLVDDMWEDLKNVRQAQVQNMHSKEWFGYPTQKPESLIERILLASSSVGNVVADFFMGGGTTGAVSLKLGRQFIGCDISRVAISVTASRLIDIAEQISGITVTNRSNPTLPMKQAEVADIRVGYVGSYPQDKFRGILHEEFVKFILGLYGAMPFTGQAQWIHGQANNKIVLSIGPGNPSERVSLARVDGAVKDTVRQYSRQFAEGEDKILQIIGWSFDPQCEGWKRKAAETLNSKGVKLQIDLISLGSEGFRQRIFRNVGESNLDLKFNRLNQLLSFTGAPYVGKIVVTSQSKLKVSFALEGARAIGAGAKLINCQWDFSHDGNRFASGGHALNRDGKNGDFSAVLTAEYTFPKAGDYRIAARVQDNLDGQSTGTAHIQVSESSCKIIEEKTVSL